MSVVAELPRVIGSLGTAGAGPALIAVGSLHGNERAGIRALERLVGRLEADPTGLEGRFVALAGNRGAFLAGRRYLVHDLNRAWTRERVERVRSSGGHALEGEDRELFEIDREIERVRAEAKGPVSVLDLHTTSGGGLPFVTIDDTLPNRRLAFPIPAPHVLGLEEELAGTMLGWLIDQGLAAVGFEAGQNEDPASVDRAEAAAWIVLEAAGVLRRGSRPEVKAAVERLAAETRHLPDVFEVRYRHPVRPGEAFRMDPGWASFQPVEAGERLAESDGGVVTAPGWGRILMPLYQEQGDDGFFLIRRVRRMWLALSAALRRLGVRRIVHWLPGIRRHPEVAGAYVVDRRVARFYALEVFHLLGYRREARSDTMLVMTPRGKVP